MGGRRSSVHFPHFPFQSTSAIRLRAESRSPPEMVPDWRASEYKRTLSGWNSRSTTWLKLSTNRRLVFFFANKNMVGTSTPAILNAGYLTRSLLLTLILESVVKSSKITFEYRLLSTYFFSSQDLFIMLLSPNSPRYNLATAKWSSRKRCNPLNQLKKISLIQWGKRNKKILSL